MTLKKTERIDWIDSSRGIAIILVVFCHIFFEHTRTYIYSFIIPLFFFISGMLYKQEKYKKTSDFLLSRVKSLLYPYLLWSLILFAFWAAADAGELSITKGFFGIFYGICHHDYLDWGMMMWFIPTLFACEAIYDLLARHARQKHLSILIAASLGFLYSHFYKQVLPWGLNISLSMILFYHLGSVLAPTLKQVNVKKALIILPITIIFFLISSHLNGDIYTEKGQFNNPLLFVISGLSGTLMVVVSQIIFKSRIISFWGRITLPIMILHLRAFTILKIIEKYILKIVHQDTLTTAIIYTIAAIIIISPTAIIIKKYAPFLLYPRRQKTRK